MYPEIKYLAANVRNMRTSLGMTQAQLGESAGCGTAVVARIERAEESARLLTLLRLAEALETPLATLFAEATWKPPVRGRPKA